MLINHQFLNEIFVCVVPRDELFKIKLKTTHQVKRTQFFCLFKLFFERIDWKAVPNSSETSYAWKNLRQYICLVLNFRKTINLVIFNSTLCPFDLRSFSSAYCLHPVRNRSLDLLSTKKNWCETVTVYFCYKKSL